MSQDFSEEERVLLPFVYDNGYRISFIDMANLGVKIEMCYPGEEIRAILLPVEQAEKFEGWLGCRIGHEQKKKPRRVVSK